MYMPRRFILILLGLFLPTLAVVATALLLMQLPKDTRVEIELVIDRLTFRTGGMGPVTLIHSGRFQSISFNRFEQLRYWPSHLEIADEARFDYEHDSFPTDAWQKLSHSREVTIEATDAQFQPVITMTSEDSNTPGMVKSVLIDPGIQVVVEAGGRAEKSWLGISIESQPRPVHVTLPEQFIITADYAQLLGTQAANQLLDSLTLRTKTNESDPLVEITGTSRGLVLELESDTLPNKQSNNQLLVTGQIPISEIDFTWQDSTGQRQSTISGESMIRYPNLPVKGEHKLIAGDFVTLDGLKKARIESISLTKVGNKAALHLWLDATAATLRIGTPERSLDARLTWFDWLWHNPILRWLFTVVAWLVPTSIAGFRLWRELRDSRI